MNGFGKVRSRQWFAEQFLDLCGKPPATLEGGPIRWLTDRRYSFTEYSTNWNDPQTNRIVTIPRGSTFLPLEWYWKRFGTPRVPEWERVIQQHAELANGRTKDSLLRMERFLNGKIIILGGQLRLMPSAASDISVDNTVAETKALIEEIETHASAGRVPIPKDSTKERFLNAAEQFEDRTGGRRIRPDRSLFE